uniref:Calcium uniporter protein n=2 Tax=Wuchereria bancrofti TaxID=6293 RepID=A0A1I8EPB5_WUCBA
MRCRWYSITGLLRQRQQHLQIQLSTCYINLNNMHHLRRCSNDTTRGNLHIWYQNGLPVLEVPLPSRREICQFTLKPIGDTVSRFCKNIECEDKGIEIVYVYSTNGNRIAGSTLVKHLLLRGNFRLRINDFIYTVEVPSSKDVIADVMADSDVMQKFDDLRSTITPLYSIMNVEEYKAFQERLLIEEYENVKAELKPLIQAKFEIDEFCRKRAQRILWLTLAAMGFQAGFLARLTWWDYSWDVMEPITYFATHVTLIASFAYYLYTNQYYNHNDHKKRVISLYFHKEAAKSNFDISRFNELQNVASSLKHDLKRLRDPLYQHLPAARLASLLQGSEKMRPRSFAKKRS